MESLTQIRWIIGGSLLIAPRGNSTLRSSTRKVTRTSCRATYEMLWPGWSKQTTGDGPGPILNRMHKYVVSTTLTRAPWKESTIISGNAVEEITKLKQQPGKDIIIDGSASLVQSLMRTDLIDEYRFLVQPFVMGRGRRFFPDGTPPTKLRLVESKTLGFGSLALTYQPANT
jgi:dihydrofolate reductase